MHQDTYIYLHSYNYICNDLIAHPNPHETICLFLPPMHLRKYLSLEYEQIRESFNVSFD